MDIDLLKRVELLGGEVHRAMLKATICDSASSKAEAHEAVVTQKFIPILIPEFVNDSIESIDVHTTEPWVLVNVKYSRNSKIFMMNYTTKEILMSLLSQKIYMAKFIAQEQWFATGDNDGYVTIYACNSTNEKIIKRFSAHKGYPVHVLSVHPTYPFLLTSSTDDTWIRLWDWVQGWKCTRIFNQREDPRSIICNPLDTDTFACTSATVLKIWAVGRSKEGCQFQSLDSITTLEVKAKGYCFGGDSHRNSMITCPEWDSEESYASIWDMRTKECVHKLSVNNTAMWDIVCHPTLPIWVTTSGRTVCLWDARTYRLMVGCEKGIAILTIDLPILKTDLETGGKS